MKRCCKATYKRALRKFLRERSIYGFNSRHTDCQIFDGVMALGGLNPRSQYRNDQS